MHMWNMHTQTRSFLVYKLCVFDLKHKQLLREQAQVCCSCLLGPEQWDRPTNTAISPSSGPVLDQSGLSVLTEKHPPVPPWYIQSLHTLKLNGSCWSAVSLHWGHCKRLRETVCVLSLDVHRCKQMFCCFIQKFMCCPPKTTPLLIFCSRNSKIPLLKTKLLSGIVK